MSKSRISRISRQSSQIVCRSEPGPKNLIRESWLVKRILYCVKRMASFVTSSAAERSVKTVRRSL